MGYQQCRKSAYLVISLATCLMWSKVKLLAEVGCSQRCCRRTAKAGHRLDVAGYNPPCLWRYPSTIQYPSTLFDMTSGCSAMLIPPVLLSLDALVWVQTCALQCQLQFFAFPMLSRTVLTALTSMINLIYLANLSVWRSHMQEVESPT